MFFTELFFCNFFARPQWAAQGLQHQTDNSAGGNNNLIKTNFLSNLIFRFWNEIRQKTMTNRRWNNFLDEIFLPTRKTANAQGRLRDAR